MEKVGLSMAVRQAAERWRRRWRHPHPAGRAVVSLPSASESEVRTEGVREPAALGMEERLQDFLYGRYDFRFNLLTEVTEFREKGGVFRPVTDRALNALCIAAHREGIACWDRDVKRFVHSDLVAAYHPFHDYLSGLPDWDGEERVGSLAGRVSSAPFWREAFHRWMLGMVAQWSGMACGLHAHCVAPLLVSDRQGMGKSAFCRAIVPPELRAYYSDNVDLAQPGKVERQLGEMALLNLDEFDRITPKRMPLLKNLMQSGSLTLRKAYHKHACEQPRTASFIGTSNSHELLTDPSGSRRFICVLVTRPIDSADIDHAQVYAQLRAELARGERYWFDGEEEEALRRNNAGYYRISPAEEVFRRCFRAARSGEEGQLRSLPELLACLKRRFPGVTAGVNLSNFARALAAAGVQKQHTRFGNRYRVVEVER